MGSKIKRPLSKEVYVGLARLVFTVTSVVGPPRTHPPILTISIRVIVRFSNFFLSARRSKLFTCHLSTPCPDLRQLGQKTQVARSTLDQVRAKIASLREATQQQTSSKQYDCNQRLKEIQAAEEVDREAKRLKKLNECESKLKAKPAERVYHAAVTSTGEATKVEGEEDEMTKLMGFSGGFKPRK